MFILFHLIIGHFLVYSYKLPRAHRDYIELGNLIPDIAWLSPLIIGKVVPEWADFTHSLGFMLLFSVFGIMIVDRIRFRLSYYEHTWRVPRKYSAMNVKWPFVCFLGMTVHNLCEFAVGEAHPYLWPLDNTVFGSIQRTSLFQLVNPVAEIALTVLFLLFWNYSRQRPDMFSIPVWARTGGKKPKP